MVRSAHPTQAVPSYVGSPYSESYQFQAVELKQTAFRLDGVFVPKELELPLIFVEIQFQKDERFYGRFFNEIMLYLYQQQPKQKRWQTVAIFPTRAVDNGDSSHYELLLPRLQRIYRDEVLPQQPSSVLNLLAMIIANADKAINIAKDLLQQPFNQSEDQTFLLNAVETILFYKLPKLTREEIWNMINMTHVDITHTSWYKEGMAQGMEQGMQKGKLEGEALVLKRQLSKRFGQLPNWAETKLEQATSHELEHWAEIILDAKTLESVFTAH